MSDGRNASGRMRIDEQWLDFRGEVADNLSDGPVRLRLDGRVRRSRVRIMNFRKLLMAMLPLTLVLASAHPGHDLMEHGAGHVASSPYHLFVLAAVAVVTLGVAQMVRNASAKKYLRFAAATALVVAGAMWGLGI